MMKLTNKQLTEMRKEVKKATGYNLNQIDIVSFSNEEIHYSIYKNYENDSRLGRDPISSGIIER